MTAKPTNAISKALQLIAGKPARYKSVKDLLVHLNISEKKLRREFKTQLGTTPAGYLRRIKMKQAKEMVLDNVPQERIAKMNGYKSKGAFMRAFKNYYSVTPHEIKRTCLITNKIIEMEALFTHLETLGEVSQSLRLFLKDMLRFRTYGKDSVLLIQGEMGDKVWFLESGIARWYFTDQADGTETTNWFSVARDVILEPASFYSQVPAGISIQAVEDCHTIFAEYRDIMHLYEKFPETVQMGRKIADTHANAVMLHNQALQKKKSEEKIKYIHQQYPQLIGAVPAPYIASFINLSLSTYYKSLNKLT